MTIGTLSEYLDAGRSLGEVRDIQTIALMVVHGRHGIPVEHRAEQLGDLVRTTREALEGLPVDMDGVLEAFDHETAMRKAEQNLWVCEALLDDQLGTRFEQALPLNVWTAAWEVASLMVEDVAHPSDLDR